MNPIFVFLFFVIIYAYIIKDIEMLIFTSLLSLIYGMIYEDFYIDELYKDFVCDIKHNKYYSNYIFIFLTSMYTIFIVMKIKSVFLKQ